MRLFEILLLTANGLLLLQWSFQQLRPFLRPRWYLFLPLATLLLLLLHLLREGYRWQMVPAYGLTTVLLLLIFIQAARPTAVSPARPRWQTILGGLVGLVVLAVAAALPTLLPVPSLPSLSGPYPVGTFSLYLVDNGRNDIYADDPNTPRELMVQFWYPAAPTGQEETAVLLPDLPLTGPIIAERFGLPPFLLNHVNLIDLGISQAPPAANGRFPLILFAHGLTGLRGQNSSMVRQLASHGYVVAAIDHTYANAIATFPDGRIYLYDPCRIFSVLPDCRTNYVDGQPLVGQWAGDMAFLLDTVERWDETTSGILAGRVDTTQVGVFGHSTGGGATLQFCLDDARCAAGLGLDAWLLPVTERVLSDPPSQPFLFISTPRWLGQENQARGRALLDVLETGYELTLLGTGHYDFSDIVLLSPLTARLGISGEIDSAYSMQIQNQVVLAFFDRYLKLADEDFLERPSPYPELTITGPAGH
jgi:predicted dienelactone hydrolase